jgi:hypothetical protein
MASPATASPRLILIVDDHGDVTTIPTVLAGDQVSWQASNKPVHVDPPLIFQPPVPRRIHLKRHANSAPLTVIGPPGVYTYSSGVESRDDSQMSGNDTIRVGTTHHRKKPKAKS